jgi:hypothetical protein
VSIINQATPVSNRLGLGSTWMGDCRPARFDTSWVLFYILIRSLKELGTGVVRASRCAPSWRYVQVSMIPSNPLLGSNDPKKTV